MGQEEEIATSPVELEQEPMVIDPIELAIANLIVVDTINTPVDTTTEMEEDEDLLANLEI